MKKRLIGMAILLLIAGSASAVFVDSFESGAGAWETIADGGVLTVVTAPPGAVTDGSYSLMAAHTDAAGYVELARISNETSTDWWNTFRDTSNNTIQFDVYVEAEAIDANWAQVGLKLQGDGYEESFSIALTKREVNQVTVVVDYSSVDDKTINDATRGWAAIFFNAGPGSTRTPVYIDNFQVVPEPATVGMLGLGGLLALLVRRITTG